MLGFFDVRFSAPLRLMSVQSETPICIKVTRKHQITLTKPLREHLGVAEGDQVEAAVGAEGEVIVRAAPVLDADPFTDL